MRLKLHTEKGIYHYKFIPIFLGIKKIDKIIAHENLLILRRLCNEAGLNFILFYGTLLGAVREHDFITHDEDIDVVMYKADMAKFLNLLFELRKEGFELARYERRGLLSIIRKGEYIDVYFYEPYPQDSDLWYCCQDICKKEYVLDLISYKFRGNDYLIPRNYIGYLNYYFGTNWRTPIQFLNFNKSILAKIKEYTIQYIKAALPPAITEWRQRKTDAPKLKHWLKKIYEEK